MNGVGPLRGESANVVLRVSSRGRERASSLVLHFSRINWSHLEGEE